MLIGGDPAGQRLLLTTLGGQPAAVLYEKHVAGTAEAARGTLQRFGALALAARSSTACLAACHCSGV